MYLCVCVRVSVLACEDVTKAALFAYLASKNTTSGSR